jgi:glycosyltransferase involved in cell wall biosynthesis
MNRKKILIALFRLPYPATDGTRYKILYNLAEGLKKDFDIEFFVVNIKSYRQEDINYLEQNFGKVHVFHHSKIAYGLNAIPALFNGLPLQAQAFRFRDAQKWLDVHIDEYAAVYVHEIRMTEFFIQYSENQKKNFLIDFNDAISMNYRDGVKKMGLLKKLFYSWEGKRVAHYESKVLESFSYFSIVSNVDRKYLLSAPTYHGPKDIDFGVILHGAPMVPVSATLDRNSLFFMGSMDYEPNRDALSYFFSTIWPVVRQEIPDMEFLVIGGGNIPESYRSIPGVKFLGFVPNIFDAVQHCKALIAPIRFAGGTPSKILEAMGYGIPVITTPIGAKGIAGSVPDENILTISDTSPQAWVTAIERIITDDAWRTMIAANGRKLIMEKYSADAAQDAFRKRFQTIIE